MSNQKPGLCDTCAYRGQINYIKPEQDSNSNELNLLLFCKAPTLINNDVPFELPIYESNPDGYGNVFITTAITNCTEYRANGILVINYVAYDCAGNLSVNFTVSGLMTPDTVSIYQFGNANAIGTYASITNGTYTKVIAGSLTDNLYGFFGVLVGATYQSNIFPLLISCNPAPQVFITDVEYTCSSPGNPTLTVSYSVVGSSGTDTLNVYIGSTLLFTIVNVPNGNFTNAPVTVAVADGNYNIYGSLVTALVISGYWPITISCPAS